jgi:D-psicose/D-tagatose/L-ribulose 3-epimerase
MMSFGVSTWLWESPFQNETLKHFEKIKKMGFDCVEIPVEDTGLIDISKVAEALKEFELKPIVCGAFGPTRDLTHEDPKVHEICFQYLRECFEICNGLGADFLAGPMYSAVGKARILSEEGRRKEWDLAVSNLQKVCGMANDFGVSLAIESLNRFESDLVNTAEDVVRLVEDINHPRAGILLDSFHMTIEEKDLKDAILKAGKKLIHVQVSENHRGIPGTGLTPWENFRDGLWEINYQGIVSIESFTPNVKELAGAVCIWKTMAKDQDTFAREGLHFLKKLFNR